MRVVCGKPKTDFSEPSYPDFKKTFWETIKYTEVKIVNLPPPTKNDGN